MTRITLQQFESDILSRQGKQISLLVQKRYQRFLYNWALHRFGATFPPRFTVELKLNDSNYCRFIFFSGTIAEQIADVALNYTQHSFSWFELLCYTFQK